MPIKVAIISNSVTPYRIHLHCRIGSECPDLEVWSVFTHEFSNAPWKLAAPEEIRPIRFGGGEHSEAQSFIRHPLHEMSKARRIQKWLRAEKIQAVVLFGYNDWCRLALLAWCRYRRIPCFLFGDSNLDCEQGSGLKMLVKRALLPPVLRLARGAMHCGRRGAEYFQRYGVPRERLFPFPYEPDYRRVAEISDADREQAMRRFSLEPGRRRILYAGRLVSIKRVDLLIAAFQEIVEARPDWDLLIAGDGPLRTTLAAQVSPPHSGRVRFLGFINDPEQLAALYGISDVLVLPSDNEPWGVVVSEAATRLALVCSTRVGAAADLVQDGRNGRIFSAGSVSALQEALLDVTRPECIDRMKAASPLILADWRAQTDPVSGLRRALRAAGLGN